MDDPANKEEKTEGQIEEQPEKIISQAPKQPPDTNEPEEMEMSGPADQSHPYEKLLDDYPLREPGEDPVWSVRIARGWLWFLAFTVTGILLLTILGFFYD